MDAALRRLVLLAMAVLLAVLSFTFLVAGEELPAVLLALDLLAIAAVAIPWHRFPPDAFASVGVAAAVVAGALVPPDDPLRGRLIIFAVLFGASAVSQRAGVVVGVIGAMLALIPPGTAETTSRIVSAVAALLVGGLVPALVSTARAPLREPIAPSALNDYIAVLAHEVSNPIVSIGAAAQVLAKQLHGRESERSALAIAEEARQVYTLLEGLSDLSALESGRLRLSVRTFDLAALTRGGFALVELGDRRLVLDVADEEVLVSGDDRRIRQVLRNLIANAVAYSGAGTQIEVRVGRTADRRSAIVQVQDHGPGIPPNERDRLFGKFARLSTAGGTRGSGLGLHLSRAIIADHGGEIWGEWPTRGGSIFSFTLPLAARPVLRSPQDAISG